MTIGVKDAILIALCLALAGALFGLRHYHEESRVLSVKLGQSEVDVANARETGQQCSRSVTALEEKARDAETMNKPLIDAAKAAEKDAGTKAQQVIMEQPSKPNDLCASAVDFAEKWLKERK